MPQVATNDESLKGLVRSKYTHIAKTEPSAAGVQSPSCCSGGPPPTPKACCGNGVSNLMADDYKDVSGYNPDADLGLGCGLPTRFAQIQPGDTVVDLGSGAGNDCFVARAETGETGKVIGVDFTPSMIDRARRNVQRRGYDNVEFVESDIEHIPLSDATADVIVSNCVLNLVPDKAAVYREIWRLLKPGGHFSVSDIVIVGKHDLPAKIRSGAELYAGCVAGAMVIEEYLGLIPQAGFVNIKLQQKKSIVIPDEIYLKVLNQEQLQEFKASGTGIYSISVYAEKPAQK